MIQFIYSTAFLILITHTYKFLFNIFYFPQMPPTKTMKGFLNNLPKFNKSLSDLLFLTFNIKIVSRKSFFLLQLAKTHCYQQFYNISIFAAAIPSQSFLVAWKSDHRTPCSLPLPHSRFDSSLSGVR